MSDLHERLTAAVQRRLELAQAAGKFYIHSIDCANGVIEHIAANDPATVIRQCESWLRVLGRHRPESIGDTFLCHACRDYAGHLPWPCDDIRDLAAALGVVVGGDGGG